MKKIIGTILIIASCAGLYWWFTQKVQIISSIREISTIHDINPYLHGYNTLVIFDIDNTLLKAEHIKATPQWFDFQIEHLKQKGLTQQQAIKTVIAEQLIPLQTTPVSPAEKTTPDFMHQLDLDDVPVLALTARSEQFITATQKQLRAINIDLSDDAPEENLCFVLDSFKEAAYYTPGILFASGNDKGKVLQAFLKTIRNKPETIIFVDDVYKNVKNVEKIAQEIGIKNFYGFRYGHLDNVAEQDKRTMQPLIATT